MHRKFGLDAWRALAIALVIWVHCNNTFHLTSMLTGGLLGVDLFFILSGFLIGQILLKIADTHPSFHSLKIFLLQRWFRTLPNYLLFLIINILIIHKGWEVGWRYVIFVQNFLSFNVPFFSESWSLSVEEWFYVIMPVLFLLSLKLFSDAKAALLLAILFMLGLPLVLRAYALLHLHHVYIPNTHSVVIYRLDSLAYGVLAAYLKYFYYDFWQKHAVRLRNAGIVMVGLLIWATWRFTIKDPLFAVFQPAFTALAFIFFLPWADVVGPTRSSMCNTLINRVSLYSYSLYLCHLPLLHSIIKIQPFLHKIGMAAPEITLSLSLGWLTACVVLSGAIYHFYEKPIMQLRERFS